jgi:hypothetical protein
MIERREHALLTHEAVDGGIALFRGLLRFAHLFEGDKDAVIQGIAREVDGAMTALSELMINEVALA